MALPKFIMTNVLLYYLITINVVTFLVYGVDKVMAVSQRGQSQTRLSYAERKHTTSAAVTPLTAGTSSAVSRS